ncbi:MAG: translation elongation factor Ts, partial [Acutalibacteraceae bacterium]
DATAAKDEFKEMGKDVAMQVAALSPSYLNPESIPDDVIEHEKEIEITQMKADPKMASKPQQILEKIVEGKMGKYYSEVCLLNQPFVKDGSMSVEKYVESVAKKLGASIKVKNYICFVKGEGLQKREENFADEIKNMIQ